ncbi:MAG: hypothetical protein GEU94_08850 [Micromonosporaceae bacterium]|nr:hypothetical protein [Micromonosporaceae bacterium]
MRYAAAKDRAGLGLRGYAVVPGADPDDPARVARRLVFRERGDAAGHMPEPDGPRLWDLVVPAASEQPGRRELRFGTYLDDVTQKQNIMVYPRRDLTMAGEVRRLRPYYTVRNTLAIISSSVDIPRGADE